MNFAYFNSQVLTHAVTQNASSATLERARQLLSYSLIHPAISVDERRALIQWLRALEDRLADLRKPVPPPPPTEGKKAINENLIELDNAKWTNWVIWLLNEIWTFNSASF